MLLGATRRLAARRTAPRWGGRCRVSSSTTPSGGAAAAAPPQQGQDSKDEEAKPPAPSGLAALAPGVGASAAIMAGSFALADPLGAALLAAQGVESAGGGSPISGVPIAILSGLALNNLALSPQQRAALAPGLALCKGAVLQAGIIAVGLKLSFVDVSALGAVGLPAVATSVGAGLLSVRWLNARLGLGHRLGSLIAAGTSICGVTAITALAPAIRATEQEVAFAVANVVAFGLFGMLAYPYLAHHAFDGCGAQVGLFLGTAIHDTAQVMGAAATYSEVFADETALKVAAVTKLTRNLFLAGVIPGLAVLSARDEAAAAAARASAAGGAGAGVGVGVGAGAGAGAEGAAAVAASGLASNAGAPGISGASSLWQSLVRHTPKFVYGFMGMVGLRSLGDYGVLASGEALGCVDPATWAAVTAAVPAFGTQYLLGSAMAAVGLSTSVAVFKGVGLRPFAVGMGGAMVVGLTGFGMSYALGGGIDINGAAAVVDVAAATAVVAAEEAAAAVATS